MFPKRKTHPDCIISTFLQNTILVLVFGHLYIHFMPGMADLSSEKMTKLWRRAFQFHLGQLCILQHGTFRASRWNFSSQRCLQRRKRFRRYLMILVILEILSPSVARPKLGKLATLYFCFSLVDALDVRRRVGKIGGESSGLAAAIGSFVSQA